MCRFAVALILFLSPGMLAASRAAEPTAGNAAARVRSLRLVFRCYSNPQGNLFRISLPDSVTATMRSSRAPVVPPGPA